MRRLPVSGTQKDRVAASLPFVEALARRLVASMPHSIDIGDLIQDGIIGLIDAAHRFDEKRGIKFETFAERRVRGAMIDALRRDAWPRGIRRMRRELEAARETLRHELGHEPSLADLAAHLGADEARLGRTIVRIHTIESTSPLANSDNIDGASLPPVLVPSEPPSPDKACEQEEIRSRVRAAISALPWRERKVIGLYYYGDVTMKQIGAEIGVNESRVSQLHARAIERLRRLLGPDLAPDQVASALGEAVTSRLTKMRMAKASAEMPSRREERVNGQAAAASRRDVTTERVRRQAQHALSSSKGVVVVAYSEARQAQRSTTGRRPLNRRTAVVAAR